jgi:Uma2 family endonuclease
MEQDGKLPTVSSAGGKKATYADLEALPQNVVGQIIDGELFAFPRPSAEHSIATSALGGLLNVRFQQGIDGPGGWWILHEPELHLGDDVVVPDLAGWRTVRLARPSGPALAVAPDWACEALSPSTASVDRVKKTGLYAREGIEHLWLLDPLARTLEVFQRSGSGWDMLGT